VEAGFALLPLSILMFTLSGRVGMWAAKHGARLFMTIGPLIASIGMGMLYFFGPGKHYATYILPAAILFGVGLVLMVAPLTTTVMNSVGDEQSGIASGINNAVSRAAGLIVIAVLGLLGSSHVYHFAMALSAGMAAASGIMSFLVIRDHVLTKKSLPRTSRPL
jgi:MFS family permease